MPTPQHTAPHPYPQRDDNSLGFDYEWYECRMLGNIISQSIIKHDVGKLAEECSRVTWEKLIVVDIKNL